MLLQSLHNALCLLSLPVGSWSAGNADLQAHIDALRAHAHSLETAPSATPAPMATPWVSK
jgi:hypothetical protein